MVHLSAAGAELWRSASGEFACPESVSVNPTDGSCWVADTYHNQVVQLVDISSPVPAFSASPRVDRCR